MKQRLTLIWFVPLMIVGMGVGLIIWPMWAGILYAKDSIISPAIQDLE